MTIDRTNISRFSHRQKCEEITASTSQSVVVVLIALDRNAISEQQLDKNQPLRLPCGLFEAQMDVLQIYCIAHSDCPIIVHESDHRSNVVEILSN